MTVHTFHYYSETKPLTSNGIGCVPVYTESLAKAYHKMYYLRLFTYTYI